MVQLTIDNRSYALNCYWFHYNESPASAETYELCISLEETALMSLIESYAECTIDSYLLSSSIIEKDKWKRSMGLLWNLSLDFKKRYVHDSKELNWVINNIKSVFLKETELVISGECSMFDSDFFNG